MIKEVKLIPQKRFVLDEKEAGLVEYCLNYCFHRKNVHNSPGVSGVDMEQLNRLRKQFSS